MKQWCTYGDEAARAFDINAPVVAFETTVRHEAEVTASLRTPALTGVYTDYFVM